MSALWIALIALAAPPAGGDPAPVAAPAAHVEQCIGRLRGV